MDFSQFQDIPIIDGHVHFVHPERMDELLGLMDEAGHGRANLVCIPNPDASTHNPAALYFKERHPERVYLSGALEYAPVLADRANASRILAGQVRALKAQGFDGLKLIEGKPQVRKLLPIPLDGPEYAGMWQALEEEQLPVVFHVADPDEFWDPERCPGWAKTSGWDYTDGSYPSKEDCYAEVDHILERHPDLKLTLAHFYFLSAELERAARFLDAHPTVCFDLAPHVGMYYDFSREPARAREFFLRYPERIVYGTDMDTRVLERGPEGYEFMRSIPWLVRAMLETDGEFRLEGETFHGLGLPRDVLGLIYHGNFERIYKLGRGLQKAQR
jgi:predicted TIM-barrel fold metal-dependent hydrolase